MSTSTENTLTPLAFDVEGQEITPGASVLHHTEEMSVLGVKARPFGTVVVLDHAVPHYTPLYLVPEDSCCSELTLITTAKENPNAQVAE